MKNCKTLKSLVAMTILYTGAITAKVKEQPTVENLSVNNTLVRVPTDSRYLLLPVEESNDDARVNIVVDGQHAGTFYVRLAKSRVDYYVPLDVSKYGDHKLLLNIYTKQGRNSVRESKEDAAWKNLRMSDDFDTTNREKYRPAFHHAPLYGWMNDPNGMFYKDGVWHLYYQYNPYGSKWQNMTWGHSSSTDLVNWEHHPVAIEPNALGTVFSGSSAIDRNNSTGFGTDKIISMYTSADACQVQSLAWSDDNGETFNIYPGNPVITLETEARDPNMFWDEKHKCWVLVLAHALEREVLIFTSPDMKTWTRQSAFGKVAAQEGVWECPDMFELNVPGTDTSKWVLICNLNPGGPFGGSATQYFIGDFDGTKFTSDTDANGNIPTKWLDYGKDHYATVSWSDAPDDRRTVIGWMSNWQYAAEVPTRQFRSANTLPRDLELFTGADGDLYVASVPSPELLTLRDKLTVKRDRINVNTSGSSFKLPATNDGICEILFDIDATVKNNVEITLTNGNDKVVMIYNPGDHTMSMDRHDSGEVSFSQDFPAVTVTPTFENSGKVSVRLFVDRSSIELFGDNGHFVMTNLVFPTSPYNTITFKTAAGKARVSNLRVYSIKI